MSFKAVRVCHHNAIVMLIKLCNFRSDFSKLNKGKVIFLLFVASQIRKVYSFTLEYKYFYMSRKSSKESKQLKYTVILIRFSWF